MSNQHKGGKSKRAPGQFVALPISVLSCKGYLGLNHAAKALLIEIAMQYLGNNNGRMVLSFPALSARGWKSKDTISRARNALIEARLIVETCKGGFPSKCSRYAVTWQNLDAYSGMELPAKQFVRGAYLGAVVVPIIGARKQAIDPMVGTSVKPLAPIVGEYLEIPSAIRQSPQ
jgi:hypothetical protein